MSIKVATYSLSISGQKLGSEYLELIKDIAYEEVSHGADILTVTIIDPDYTYIEDELIVAESEVVFRGGWIGQESIYFEGYISVLDVDFPETGSPELTIHCMDKSHLMNRKKNKKTWEKKRVSEVATEIFKTYGFKTDVDKTDKVEDTITQSDSTDIAFLIEMADRQIDPFLVYVEGNTGYFKKKKILAKEQKTLHYRTGSLEIKSFSPRINKEITRVEVEGSNVNDSTKKVEKSIATDNMPRDAQGESIKTSDKANTGQKRVYNPRTGKWEIV